eukprot:bmy_13233T0
MHRDSCPLDCKLYVGNLRNNGSDRIGTNFWLLWTHPKNPPGFAFVEFEDPREAELDGRTLCGCRVRVEPLNGEKRSRNLGPPPSW